MTAAVLSCRSVVCIPQQAESQSSDNAERMHRCLETDRLDHLHTQYSAPLQDISAAGDDFQQYLTYSVLDKMQKWVRGLDYPQEPTVWG